MVISIFQFVGPNVMLFWKQIQKHATQLIGIDYIFDVFTGIEVSMRSSIRRHVLYHLRRTIRLF